MIVYAKQGLATVWVVGGGVFFGGKAVADFIKNKNEEASIRTEEPNEAEPIEPEGTNEDKDKVGNTEYPGDDPTKSPGKGWEWRGKGKPGSSQGSWYNPDTEQTLHPEPIGPHWDYKDPNGNWYRINPDGSIVPK